MAGWAANHMFHSTLVFPALFHACLVVVKDFTQRQKPPLYYLPEWDDDVCCCALLSQPQARKSSSFKRSDAIKKWLNHFKLREVLPQFSCQFGKALLPGLQTRPVFDSLSNP